MELQSPGADDCIRSIIEKHAQTVYRLAFARVGQKADAEDVFQEVFLRYIRKKPSFDSDEHEKAWFIRVTLNCSNSLLTASFRRRTEPLSEELPESDSEELELEAYLQKLPVKYRTVIHLFYYEQLSTAEMAALLHRKESTVRMQLTRARRYLKDYMEGEDFDVPETV